MKVTGLERLLKTPHVFDALEFIDRTTAMGELNEAIFLVRGQALPNVNHSLAENLERSFAMSSRLILCSYLLAGGRISYPDTVLFLRSEGFLLDIGLDAYCDFRSNLFKFAREGYGRQHFNCYEFGLGNLKLKPHSDAVKLEAVGTALLERCPPFDVVKRELEQDVMQRLLEINPDKEFLTTIISGKSPLPRRGRKFPNASRRQEWRELKEKADAASFFLWRYGGVKFSAIPCGRGWTGEWLKLIGQHDELLANSCQSGYKIPPEGYRIIDLLSRADNK